jgi:hypothetical protein
LITLAKYEKVIFETREDLKKIWLEKTEMDGESHLKLLKSHSLDSQMS